MQEGGGLITAIIGGGFSGAVVAARLASALGDPCGRIVVFEPRDELGRGLAYDTDNDAHRINVPADRMSVDSDDLGAFAAWVTRHAATADDPAAMTQDGKLYPRRGVFGRYVNDFVAPYLASGAIRHVRSAVAHVARQDAQWLIEAENGFRLRADLLVIATSHPAPQAPEIFRSALHGHPRYVPDSTAPHAFDAIRPDDRVLVVGAGLTSADVIATLDASGHKGSVTFYSRRGLRSRGHPAVAQEPFGDFSSGTSSTAMQLLRKVRATICEAEDQGLSWHAVFDALRSQAGTIWRNLALAERRRLVRHLRPFWDAHRFRIAPQVETVLERGLASGRFRLLAASASNIERENDTIWVTLRERRSGRAERNAYDAVVVTTGPAHGDILSSQTWLAELAQAGLVTSDETRLGLACDERSRAIGSDGKVVPHLFVSGPLARGTFGELMGLPQVADHARLVADGLIMTLKHAGQDPPVVEARIA